MVEWKWLEAFCQHRSDRPGGRRGWCSTISASSYILCKLMWCVLHPAPGLEPAHLSGACPIGDSVTSQSLSPLVSGILTSAWPCLDICEVWTGSLCHLILVKKEQLDPKTQSLDSAPAVSWCLSRTLHLESCPERAVKEFPSPPQHRGIPE